MTTISGTETTVCPDATATPAEGEEEEDDDEDDNDENDDNNGDDDDDIDEAPVEEPSCYPTHGDNMDRDRIIGLCWAQESDFAKVCRSEPEENGIDVACPGHTGGNTLPIANNNYDAWFDKADDAPAECDSLFQGGDDNDEVGARVDALCVPAFMAIRNKCNWNGGEAKNKCGTFKYQSCPLDGNCKPGDPSKHV